MTGSDPSSPWRTRRVNRVHSPRRPSGSTCSRGSRSGGGHAGTASPPCSSSAAGAGRGAGTAGDGADHLLAGGLGADEVARVASQEQHDDAVGHLEDVGQVVADHHHAEAAFLEPEDQVEHLSGLGHAQGRGGLVEHHQLRVAEQRARDRHDLALPARERRDLGVHVRDARRQRADQLARFLLHPQVVQHPQPAKRAREVVLLAQVEVLGNVEVVGQGEILVDGRDAEVGRVLGPADAGRLTQEAELARVRQAHARTRP